jgi:hypothetical protein
LGNFGIGKLGNFDLEQDPATNGNFPIPKFPNFKSPPSYYKT